MDKNKQQNQHLQKPRRELRTIRTLLSCLSGGDIPDWLSDEHYLLIGRMR